MKLPPGKTEEEVLSAIEKAVNILAPSFVFGFYDVADIKQEARMFALQCLDKYDCRRPLENFIYAHTKNRLINFKRDKFKRNDPPCQVCHIANSTNQRPKHEDGEFCAKYLAWKNRNAAKANIMRPLDLDYIADESEANTRLPSEAETTVETAELLQRIDEELDIELRATYLQMRAGESVPKAKRLIVEEAVKEILRGALECPSEED
jgi:DNA-directed RNA polymerase specialized sigma24 family protein